MSARLGPFRVEDREFADRLRPRDSLVGDVDGALDLGPDGRVVRGIRQRHVGGQAVVAEPGRQHLGIKRHEGGDERFLVAHDDDLADDRVGSDRVFERRRRDVLAAGRHDDLLLASRDRQEALVVERPEISRLEPVAVERGGRCLGVLPVLLEDVDAADLHLAVIGEAHTDAGEDGTHRADLGLLGEIDRRGRCGLGEPVALEDRDTEAVEEVAEPRAERGRAGDGVRHAAAHGGAQLAVDELVEQGELDLRAEGHLLALLEEGRVLDRGVRGGAEDLALAAGLGLLLRRVVDLLEDARHGQQERRLEGAERRKELLRVGLVPGLDTRVDIEDRNEAREHMRRRDEQQGGGAGGVHDLFERLRGVAREFDEVAVREHAALRASRRPRGVDERRDVGADGEVATTLDLLIGDIDTAGAQGVQGAGCHGPHVADERQLGTNLFDAGGVLCAFGEHRDRSRVGEDPAHLRGGTRLVDRHHDGAGEEEREVDERPFVRRSGEESDLVAGLDARGHESLRQGDHLALELGGRDVAPSRALARALGHGEQCERRRRLHPLDQKVADVGIGIGRDDRGDFELGGGAHGAATPSVPSGVGMTAGIQSNCS